MSGVQRIFLALVAGVLLGCGLVDGQPETTPISIQNCPVPPYSSHMPVPSVCLPFASPAT